MRFRITIILMIALGGLTAIAVGTVLFISALANIKNTLQLTRSRVELTVSIVERGVAEHVLPGRNLIGELRRRVADGTLDILNRDRLADVLSGMLAPAPQLGGVAVRQSDGRSLLVTRNGSGIITVDDKPAAGTPQFDAFMTDVANSQDLRWNKPHFLNGQTFITTSGSLIRDNKVVGSAATGISLVALSRFVGKLSESGMTAFILYGDDRVLAHPAIADERFARLLSVEKPLLSVDEINDPVLAGFSALPAVDLPGWDDFDIRESGDGQAAQLILSRANTGYGQVQWRIGVHVPVEAVSQQIKRLARSIVISLGLLIVALAAALFLASRIARPIRAVSAAAGKIERLDLDAIEPLPGSMIREIDEQARSFNQMVQGLRWFQAYVPRQIVRRLMSVTGKPDTNVREAELTVMFADIVGFTPLSENMPPANVATMLNDHFEMINACIEAENGTLDKYIGDSVMAFWGAPEPINDHAARACRTALAITKAIGAKQLDGETPLLRLKIALHTGPLIVGSIGARTRMNYTVIGDTVNVCARIETLAPQFQGDAPVTILVSGEVVRAAGEGLLFESLGDFNIKGRRRTVSIWRLVGESTLS